MIRAHPGRVLFSRCSNKIFFNKATLDPWCREVRQGIERPALLFGRYILLPFMIVLLWANLSIVFCMAEKSFFLNFASTDCTYFFARVASFNNSLSANPYA